LEPLEEARHLGLHLVVVLEEEPLALLVHALGIEQVLGGRDDRGADDKAARGDRVAVLRYRAPPARHIELVLFLEEVLDGEEVVLAVHLLPAVMKQEERAIRRGQSPAELLLELFDERRGARLPEGLLVFDLDA